MRRPQPGGTLASIRDRWRSLSLFTRRRLLALTGLAVGVVIVAFLLVPNLPCRFPGGDSCAPADEIAEIVPGDALAYVHTNLDSDTDQYRRAGEITTAVPRLSGELIERLTRRLSDGRGRVREFESEIRPWFGGELAFALLDAEEEVVVLEVADEEAAGEYAAGLESEGLATAQVDGFLVAGPEDGVRAVINTASGVEPAGSLADLETADEVRNELPDERLLEAYLSEDGVAELLAGTEGTLASIAPLVVPGSSRAVAVSVGVGEEGDLELALRGSLDPERAEDAPGFFAAFPAFEPTLAARLPPETLGYAGIGDPGETVAALLEQVPELEVESKSLDGLGDEVALSLQPPPDPAGSDAPAAAPPTGLPELSVIAEGGDEEDLRRALRALELDQTPPLAEGSGGLDSNERFRRAIEGFDDQVSLLAFLDLDRLVTLGEGLGLAEDPVYAAFAGEFRRIDALGLAVRADPQTLAADARLIFGEAQEVPPGAPSQLPAD